MSSLADDLLDAVRGWFAYPDGELRATGYLTVCFQAYADGSASCDEHVDAMDQVIVSLGASRVLVVDGEHIRVDHGDVTYVPAGTPHSVPPDPLVTTERISIVFRGAA